MNINNHPDIAGIPARKLRDALRSINPLFIGADDIARRLNISSAKADSVIKLLVEGGYLTQSRRSPSEADLFETTVLGNALANASAAAKLSRKKAERNLAEFMRRVNIINGDCTYVFRVPLIILFGSMATGDGPVSDIDLVIELEARETDPVLFQKLSRERIANAILAGKRFATYTQQLLWPRWEIYRFCTWRLRGISLHHLSDLVGAGISEYRVLLGERRNISRQIKRLATAKGEAAADI